MIVKCQRSLETTHPRVQVLFYNRACDWIWQGDLTTEWSVHFGLSDSDADNRFFAEVRWRDRHQAPEFVRRLPEQHW